MTTRSVIDMQGSTPRDLLVSSRGPLSETMYAESRPVDAATTCRDEFDETIRTVSEPECTKRRMESEAGTGSTRSVPDARPRQGFSKGSASLQSLVRRRSRRHGGSSGGGGGSSLPLEVELSSRQIFAAAFRTDDETRTVTPTSTLIHATSSSAQPSTSRADNNAGVQDVSSSASNVAATATGNNATPSTIAAGRFGNARVSLLRTTGQAKPGPSTSSSSWNNSEQENDYVVDPVQGNAYYKGQFLGKVGTLVEAGFVIFIDDRSYRASGGSFGAFGTLRKASPSWDAPVVGACCRSRAVFRGMALRDVGIVRLRAARSCRPSPSSGTIPFRALVSVLYDALWNLSRELSA